MQEILIANILTGKVAFNRNSTRLAAFGTLQIDEGDNPPRNLALLIAAIEGTWVLWRFRLARRVLPVWLLACALVTNAMWSPSPLSEK